MFIFVNTVKKRNGIILARFIRINFLLKNNHNLSTSPKTKDSIK